MTTEVPKVRAEQVAVDPGGPVPSGGFDLNGELTKFLASQGPIELKSEQEPSGDLQMPSVPVVPVPAAPAAPAAPSAPAQVATAPAAPAPAAPKGAGGPPQDVFKPKAPEAKSAPVAEPEYDPRKDPEAPSEVQRGDAKATNAWMKGKRHEKELAAKVAELEAKLKAREEVPAEKPPEIEELARLKKQVDEYESRVAQLDLAQSRGFKERFEAPMQSAFNKGVAMLMRAGVAQQDAVAKMNAIARPGIPYDAVQEQIADLPVALQGALFSTVSELSQMAEARQAALADWKKTKPAIEEIQNRRSVAEISQAIVADTDQAVSQLRQEGSWLYNLSDTDDAWNQEVKQRVGLVHGVLKAAKPDEIVRFVAEGVAAPVYRKLYEAAAAEAAQLKEELSALVTVTPGLGGGAAPKDRGAALKGPMSVTQWLDANIR